MTSLNPSHNPFSSKARTGQAIHRQSPEPSSAGEGSDGDVDSQGYPKSVARLEREARRGARREGRKRVKGAVPAIPDLRFEQSYLLSLRPFLHPRPSKPRDPSTTSSAVESKHEESNTLVTSASDDSVFHWGREVDVDWGMAAWVTARDQILSPLFQGALWGSLSLILSASSSLARQTVYPAGHNSKGRIVGGSGGGKGGGEVVGDEESGGWWRGWVRSWGGGLETLFA